MIDFINKYRKGVLAAITLALIVGKDVFGFDLDSAKADTILETAIAAIGAFSVVAVPNKQ